MPALTLRKLPGWFYTIDESRVKEAARADVILFQRECTDVLAEHFARKAQVILPASAPAPAALVPAEPPTQPMTPAPDAPRDAWRTYHRDMLAWLDWLDWQDEVERWQNLTEVQLDDHEERLRDHDQQIGELHSRMEGNEEISRVLAEALARLGPQTLTSAYQATLKRMATRLHELTGASYATIYGERNAAFHVGRYSDIAEARWLEIADWFKARIDAAERRQRH